MKYIIEVPNDMEYALLTGQTKTGYYSQSIEFAELEKAEPHEIIRCKDCKHHWTHKCMDSMQIGRCDLEQTFYDAEHDFCSLAEKREVTT